MKQASKTFGEVQVWRREDAGPFAWEIGVRGEHFAFLQGDDTPLAMRTIGVTVNAIDLYMALAFILASVCAE